MSMVVWTGFLAIALPNRHVAQNWNVAWAGFDLGLAVVLSLLAYGSLRQRTWIATAAGAAAALLNMDAWFDATTAAPGWDKLDAIVLACTSEIPLALGCLWIAGNAARVSATAHRYAVIAAHRRGETTRGEHL